ncbi:hypothetical protein DRH27_05585, partial [Candidatus Falkowbacteria bacterium]
MLTIEKMQAREIQFLKLSAREMLADGASVETIARMIASEQARLYGEYGINGALFCMAHDASGIEIINPYTSDCGRFEYS